MSNFSRGPKKFLNVMEFIDGGYLRKKMREKFGHEHIDFGKLLTLLAEFAEHGPVSPELIRAYYYDANVSPSLANKEDWKTLDDYFESIRRNDFLEVRLGRLIRLRSGRWKQKGVDTILAVDMITKAYEAHYDIAVLLAGDDDMVDLVTAVKDAGKRVYGAYFESNASKRLVQSFDRRLPLDGRAKEFEGRS